jgi:hypothetical protein
MIWRHPRTRSGSIACSGCRIRGISHRDTEGTEQGTLRIIAVLFFSHKEHREHKECYAGFTTEVRRKKTGPTYHEPCRMTELVIGKINTMKKIDFFVILVFFCGQSKLA